MSTIATEIKLKIENDPGRFWTIHDFAQFPASAVAKAFSRFFSRGLIKRYGKGLYYKPKKTILGEAPPAVSELVKNKSKERRVVFASLSAFHKLGLTTQVPSKNILACDSPLNIQGAEILVRNISRYGNACDELIMLIDALIHIEKIPDCNASEALKYLKDKFTKNQFTFSINELAQISLQERPKVRALVGLLGDMTKNISQEYRSQLKSSLNQLTRFKIFKNTADIETNLLKEWQID